MTNRKPRSAIAKNKLAYNDAIAMRDYEKTRFFGWAGRRRDAREKRAAHCAVQQFMRDSKVLDCPCGNGRWFSRLAFRANYILGIDVADEAVKAAAQRVVLGVTIETRVGDAEKLDLAEDEVEHVFCFALMKHLPDENKVRVLREFARVSSGRMAVSFCITNLVSYSGWWLRGRRGYPNTRAELDSICKQASLSIGAIYSVSLPIVGMEAIVVLEPDDKSPER